MLHLRHPSKRQIVRLVLAVHDSVCVCFLLTRSIVEQSEASFALLSVKTEHVFPKQTNAVRNNQWLYKNTS